MMASSTQESQSFVAKEVHAVKDSIAEMGQPVPQKMEIDKPLPSAQPSTVPIAVPAAPVAAAPALVNVQNNSTPSNTTVSVPTPVPAPVAIAAQVPSHAPVQADVPTPSVVPASVAAPTTNTTAPVTSLSAPAMNFPPAEMKNAPNGLPSSEKPTTDVKVEAAAPLVTNAAASAPNPELEKLILQEQFKFCSSLVKQMKKRKEGFLFSNPVDPVQLNIPTYFDVIESPMDLSTIEKKISSHSYKTPNEYKDDVTLMFNNCYKFNGMEAQVSKMGMDLQKYFEKEWEKLPKELKEKKKKASRPVGNQSHSEGIHRPRREVTSIPRETLMTDVKAPSGRKLTPQLKFASSLLRDLMKKHYNPYNLAFLMPVDPEALGIPQYRDIIKNPMDLSTMRKKLDGGFYKDGDEFEADMRLMFRNCYTFNAPGSEVYNLGKELEAVFDRKWADRPPPGEYVDDKNRRASQPGVYHSAVYLDDDDSGDDDADAQHIEMLKTQVQLLTTQLTLLTEKRARKKKARAQAAMMQPKKPKNRPKSMPGSTDFAKSKTSNKRGLDFDSDVVQELTYDQKRELSENINILTQDQLGRVLQIIRENTHIDESQGEEIELDIDSLDKVTLWKLYSFVTKHTQKQKRARLDGHPESSSGSETGSDSDDSGSGSD